MRVRVRKRTWMDNVADRFGEPYRTVYIGQRNNDDDTMATVSTLGLLGFITGMAALLMTIGLVKELEPILEKEACATKEEHEE